MMRSSSTSASIELTADHAHVLVDFLIQPGLAASCVVRGMCCVAGVAANGLRDNGASFSACGNTLMSCAILDEPGCLILASTSPYRRELLARLRLPFACVAPAVDESRLPDEAPAAMARRLALAKAQAVAQQHPAAIVIGSDQVADLQGEPLGKPHSHEKALAQLQRQRGQTVLFHTAVAVVRHDTGFAMTDMATIRTRFRSAQDGMSDAAIAAYLHAEHPYDYAGSIKSEGLGIALMASIDNDDPTALIGLPLMRTCSLLRAAGLQLLPPVPTRAAKEAA